jgi:hypothetical protein
MRAPKQNLQKELHIKEHTKRLKLPDENYNLTQHVLCGYHRFLTN